MTSEVRAAHPSPTSIQAEIDQVSRSKQLFHFIEEAKRTQEVAPETAELAWNTWSLSSRTLPTLTVPDASHGPDGLFLFLWNKNEHHLELEVGSDGDAHFFYRNRMSGALWNADYKAGSGPNNSVFEKWLVL